MVAPRPVRSARARSISAVRAAVQSPRTGYPTGFVGRRSELRALRALVGPGRIVSLVGPPGIGKTRLASEVAGGSPSAVEVSLRGITDAAGLVGALGSALGVRLPEGPDEARVLGRLLAEREPSLVWFDACEGLGAEGRAALGAACGELTEVACLVTSQRHLGLASERVLALEPLRRGDALALLVERVAHARGGVGLDPHEMGRAEALLERLDHLPLAVELAASRLALMDLDQLLERLEVGLGVLDRGAVLSRAVDWAIDLLAPHERSGLAQATRFRGGFDLEAAEAVVDVGTGSVLDWLSEMVARSLVSVRRGPGGARYEVYEAVELRAVAHLDASAGRAADARHAAHYARALARWGDHDVRGRRRWLDRERANLAAAEARAEDPAVFVDLVLAQEVGRFGGRGEAQDRRRVGDAVARAREGGATPRLARALVEEGRYLRLRGAVDAARASLDEACGIARDLAKDGLRALTQVERGRLLADLGEGAAAVVDLEAGIALAGELPRVAADAHVSLGVVAYHGGDLDAAERAFERAGVLYERVGDDAGRATALANAAAVARSQERLERARRGFAEAAQLHHREGNLRGEGIACSNLANVERCLGRYDDARERFAEALRLHRFVGNRRSEALAHCFLGYLELAEGDLDAAERELERARVTGEGVMSPADFALVVDGRVEIAEARGELDRARRLRAEAEGLRCRVPPLRVAGDGAWFVHGSEPVLLDRRDSARRVLAALVALRERAPEASLTREAMVEAGWPDERILERAARQRLYVLVNTLRKLGLDALETTDAGYRLDPRVPLSVED